MTDVIKLSKRAFTWSVVIMTVLWSMGISALVPLTAHSAVEDCIDLSAGDNFTVEGDVDGAVYLVTSDLERMPYPTEGTFLSWHANFDGVVEIAAECGELYPSASRGVTARSGAFMYKLKAFPSVFAILPGGEKAHVSSEAIAAALYGSNWNTKIVDFPAAFDTYFSQGDALTEEIAHNGQLIQVEGSDDVWYVWNGELSMVSGELPAYLASTVRTVSASVADLPDSGNEVTPAALTDDPSEGHGSGGSVDSSDDDGDDDADGPQGTLTVSIAADTPSGSYAVENAVRVPFTKLNFTASGGDVTVNSFKVKRTGSPAQDSDFSKVNMIDQNGNLLNETGKTLNSDSMVTFTEDLWIPSGQTRSYTIVGDIAASVGGGNLPRLALYSLDTGADVVATLPLEGNPVDMNTNIALGTVTLAEGAQVGTVTEQVGELDVNLANLQVTVATNDFQLERVMMYNSGTTGDDDVQGFELHYNNNKVADGIMKNKYLTFDLGLCGASCKLPKGETRTFQVYGDIISGSARNINLDVRRVSHVLVKDLKHGYYRSPTNNASAMTNTVSVSEGRLTISKTNDTPASNVPENDDNVELGSWNFKVQGEPITVNTMVLKITTTGTVVPTGFDNVTLFNAAGIALTGGADGALANSPGYATSTDAFTLPVGDNVIYARATIDSTPAENDTVQLAIDMTNSENFDATGEDSGEAIDLGTDAFPNSSYVAANTQTIKTASLRVTTLSTPPTTTIAAGTNDFVFTHVMFDAGNSSEDIKVTQVKVQDQTGSTGKTIDLQNCELWVDKDGDSFDNSGVKEALTESKSGTDSDAGDNETLTFNLSGADQFIIKKGKKNVMHIACDIAGGAATGTNATHRLAVDVADYVSATGVNTGNTVTEVIDTDSAAAGQTMTFGAAGGTVQVSVDASNIQQKLYAGGTQGVTLGIFNFFATSTENVELDTIKFTQRVTDTASSSFRDYALLYAEDEDGVMVGSLVPTSTTPVIDFIEDKFVVDIADSNGKKLYLKANLATIGTQQSITVGGHQLGFNIAAKTDVIAKGELSGSGSTEFFGSNVPNGKTHYMFKGLPTVEVLSVGGTLANGSNDIFKVKVSANTNDVAVYKFTFDIATTTASIGAIDFYDVTDAQEVHYMSTNTDNGTNQPNKLAHAGYLEVLLDDQSASDGVVQGGEEIVVSVGTPRTFLLRANASAVASGASISTRMGGDSKVIKELQGALMAPATTTDDETHDDFIWSDQSAQVHSTTTRDWTNGFLVSGLNSASTTQTVVAK